MFSSRTCWPLEPNRLAQALAQHRKGGRPLLDLTASNPPACGFDYPRDEILAALADPRALEYSPESKGRLEARQAIADYYRGRARFGDDSPATIDPERLILTSGTSEAYSHVFRLLCEPGDEILVPEPSYPLFSFLADLNDVQLVPYPLLYDNGWQINFAALRAFVGDRSRAVMVVHPNNPTGSFVKAAEAAELAAICSEHEMAIVADEVFLHYPAPSAAGEMPAPAPSFAFGSKALTFALSGLSKIAALPQMKLAWIAVGGPEELARTAVERLDVIADTYLSPSVPVQLAAAKFLALGASMRSQILERIAANLATLDAALAVHPAGTVTRLDREGGWYAILRVPASRSDEDLAVELALRHSVLIHPGSFYNFPSEGFLVLSLIATRADFDEGLRRMLSFFD